MSLEELSESESESESESVVLRFGSTFFSPEILIFGFFFFLISLSLSSPSVIAATSMISLSLIMCTLSSGGSKYPSKDRAREDEGVDNLYLFLIRYEISDIDLHCPRSTSIQTLRLKETPGAGKPRRILMRRHDSMLLARRRVRGRCSAERTWRGGLVASL